MTDEKLSDRLEALVADVEALADRHAGDPTLDAAFGTREALRLIVAANIIPDTEALEAGQVPEGLREMIWEEDGLTLGVSGHRSEKSSWRAGKHGVGEHGSAENVVDAMRAARDAAKQTAWPDNEGGS